MIDLDTLVEGHPIYEAIDLGGGQACNIEGVIRELDKAGYDIVLKHKVISLLTALQYVLEDEIGGLPRATSACRDVVRKAIKPWDVVEHHRVKPVGQPSKPVSTDVEPVPRFKTGDVVVLNSGGPRMTVVRVGGDRDTFLCEVGWFVGGDYRRDCFMEEELQFDVVAELREIGNLKPGDPMPAWAQPNEWGSWISRIATRAADEIERLRAKPKDTRLKPAEYGQ